MVEETKEEEGKSFLELLIEYIQQKKEALKPKLEKAVGP
jgi:predicted CopG family antitoxin